MAAEADEAAAEAADDALQAAHAACMRALGSQKHCVEKVTPTGLAQNLGQFSKNRDGSTGRRDGVSDTTTPGE